MKKIITIATVLFASLTVANAQNTFPEYPAEWGTLKDFYEIPVPFGPGYECETYLLGRTPKGGTIFAGPGKLCHYDQTFTGAYFSYDGYKWVFTPAYVRMNSHGIAWSGEDGKVSRALNFQGLGRRQERPDAQPKEKYEVVAKYFYFMLDRAKYKQDPEAKAIMGRLAL